jgi:predicted DCC family thiol-disulfide oxidoreductase YuxK
VNSVEEFGGRLLVVFDGHCGLCNGAVRWLLRRDRRDRLRFVAANSPKVATLLVRRGFTPQNTLSGPDTILVVCAPGSSEERIFARSDAVLALLRELPRPWPGLAAVLDWIPRPLRDLGYRFVARWRYRIGGQVQNCPLPSSEQHGRFL